MVMLEEKTSQSISGIERLAATPKARQPHPLPDHADAGREPQTCITNEIVQTTPLAQSTVSQHLKVWRSWTDPRRDRGAGYVLLHLDPAGVRWLKDQIERWLPHCCAPAGTQLNLEQERKNELDGGFRD